MAKSLKQKMNESIKETDNLLKKKTDLYYRLCDLYTSLVRLYDRVDGISFKSTKKENK